MLTETNLDDSVLDNELFTDDYLVFRTDRNNNNNKINKMSGGGVLIAVSKKFSIKKVNLFGFEDLEQKSNIVAIIDEIGAIDWDDVLELSKEEFVSKYNSHIHSDLYEWFDELRNPMEDNSVNRMTWLFTVILCSVILNHTPVETRKLNSSFPPWFDFDLRKLCRRKNRLHGMIDPSNVASRKKYEEVRMEFKRLNRIAYKMYTEKLSDEIKCNPKSFFTFVNQKRKSNKFPSIMSFEGTLLEGDRSVAEGKLMRTDKSKRTYDS
ncbi:CLUMA_CG021135, isoform A [Clunio marinus]|uniref:CLUMA_CG021135, isoform A n=1 Tax=Clunio marinus TaxID=568069 RepID=A0A1J1J6M7_9DIPT|nr:CLUMA_CG021135, isoform A [Clunio marinus]